MSLEVDLFLSSLISVPYQVNGCDCGVFVCRYAYNLFLMRHLKFTWEDISRKPPFGALITKGPAFQFNMSDIARMREEMERLINNLSKIYLMKEREKADKRMKSERAKSEMDTNEEEEVGESPVAAAAEGEECEDVQESEESNLIATANVPVFGVDRVGWVNVWNKCDVRLIGYSAKEVMGRSLVQEFIADDFKKQVQTVLDQTLVGGETGNSQFITKEGACIGVPLDDVVARKDEQHNTIGGFLTPLSSPPLSPPHLSPSVNESVHQVGHNRSETGVTPVGTPVGKGGGVVETSPSLLLESIINLKGDSYFDALRILQRAETEVRLATVH